jgi:sodium-coupled neutral amino acid transporter 11
MRSLSSLSLISLTSILSVLLLTTLVVVPSFSATSRTTPSASSSVQLFGSNVLSGFGSIAFVFVCHDVSLPLFQSLYVRSPLAWRRVSTASISIALLPILLLTVVGYVCFVDGTQGNILNNFPSDDAAINLSRLVLAASMCMTYPSNLFMCRLVIERAIATWSKAGSSSTASLHYPLTALLFAVSLLIALRVEDLGVVQSIVGCVCAVTVAFLIPSACAVQVSHKFGRPYVNLANSGPLCVALLGLCIIVLTIAQMAELVAGERSDVIHTAHVY